MELFSRRKWTTGLVQQNFGIKLAQIFSDFLCCLESINNFSVKKILCLLFWQLLETFGQFFIPAFGYNDYEIVRFLSPNGFLVIMETINFFLFIVIIIIISVISKRSPNVFKSCPKSLCLLFWQLLETFGQFFIPAFGYNDYEIARFLSPNGFLVVMETIKVFCL